MSGELGAYIASLEELRAAVENVLDVEASSPRTWWYGVLRQASEKARPARG